MAAQANIYGSSLEIARNLRALEEIDRGDASSVRNNLELRLDSALIEFAIYSEAFPSCEAKTVETLSLARSYRAKNSGPMQATSSQPMVTKALSLCRAPGSPPSSAP
jgi:hypothetical protein